MNIEMIIAILFFPAIILLMYVGCKTTEYFYERADRKHREKYKDLYTLEAEYAKAQHSVLEWERNEVERCRKEIDTILNEMKYLPEEEKEFYEQRLVTLKAVYADKVRFSKGLEKKELDAYENLRRYVKDNNIDWYSVKG